MCIVTFQARDASLDPVLNGKLSSTEEEKHEATFQVTGTQENADVVCFKLYPKLRKLWYQKEISPIIS